MHLLSVREAGIMHLVVYSSSHDSQNQCKRKGAHGKSERSFWKTCSRHGKASIWFCGKRQELTSRLIDGYAGCIRVFGEKKTVIGRSTSVF